MILWPLCSPVLGFQSTPPARGATIIAIGVPKLFYISIHAPREGGDDALLRGAPVPRYFNPRPPRGGRPLFDHQLFGTLEFQSTPPARGATPSGAHRLCVPHHFNPRPPRGGRLYLWPLCLPAWAFQSTPPARGATQLSDDRHHQPFISIHAPREGGDGWITGIAAGLGISIHAPREGGDEFPGKILYFH